MTRLDVVIVTLEIMGGAIICTILVNLVAYWITKLAYWLAELISGLK